jgi:hypothetical protein
VTKDLYGSWTTRDFEPLYQLVRQAFAPDASKEEWQEAMVLLKLRIGDYYSVRNPQYGFCAKFDRAAVRPHGRWLNRRDLDATVGRLRAKGMLVGNGKSLTEEAVAKKTGSECPQGAPFLFQHDPRRAPAGRASDRESPVGPVQAPGEEPAGELSGRPQPDAEHA